MKSQYFIMVLLVMLLVGTVGAATLNVYNLSVNSTNTPERTGVNETFSVIRSGAGTAVNIAVIPRTGYALIRSNTTTGTYETLGETIWSGNTALPDGAVVDSVVFYVWNESKLNELGSLSMSITGAYPQDPYTVVASDYGRWNDTVLSNNITYSGTSSGYMAFTGNSNFTSYINKSGITSIAIRLDQDILNNDAGISWAGTRKQSYFGFTANYQSTSHAPYMVVTYHIASEIPYQAPGTTVNMVVTYVNTTTRNSVGTLPSLVRGVGTGFDLSATNIYAGTFASGSQYSYHDRSTIIFQNTNETLKRMNTTPVSGYITFYGYDASSGLGSTPLSLIDGNPSVFSSYPYSDYNLTSFTRMATDIPLDSFNNSGNAGLNRFYLNAEGLAQFNQTGFSAYTFDTAESVDNTSLTLVSNQNSRYRIRQDLPITLTINYTASSTPNTAPGPMGKLPNAATHLDIPTPDGSGQVVHPCVIYTATPWNGYNYIMVESPFAFQNESLENPSIRLSNDGYVFEKLAGQPDPIENPPALPAHFNDAYGFLNGTTLYIFYGYQSANGAAPAVTYTNYTTTTNGVTWTAPVTMTTSFWLSSSVIFNGTGWEAWAHTTPGLFLHHYTFPQGQLTNPVESGFVSGLPRATNDQWHSEVKKYDNQYQLLLVDNHGLSTLKYFNSTNGLKWFGSESNPVLTKSPGGAWDNSLYKSSFYENNSGYRVWYGGITGDHSQPTSTFWVGYTQIGVPDVAPTANFVATPVTSTSSMTVQFTDKSLYLPISWDWNFGDGSAHSNLRNPSHTYSGTEYTNPQNFTVSLTVTNSAGSDTETKNNYISLTGEAHNTPTTSFTQSETHGTPPLTVQFNDTSSAYYHITGWLWNFGEGNTSISQNPSHTFYGSGIYTVTLTTTNAYGSTSASSTVQTNGARVHPFTFPIKETPGYIYQAVEPYKSYLASIKSNADKGMAIDYTNYGVAAGFSDWKYARDMAAYGYITGNTRYLNKSIEALLHTDRIHYAATDKFEDAMVGDAALAYDFVASTLNQGNTTLDTANNTIIRNKLAVWGNFMYRRINVNGTDRNQIDVTDYMMESYVNTATVGEVLYDYTNSSLQTNATQWRACGSTDYFVNDTLHTPANNYGMAAFTADRNFGTSWTGNYKYYYMIDGNTGGNGMYRWFNIYSNIYGSVLDDYPIARGLATEEAWTSMPNGYMSNYGTDGNVKRSGTPMLYGLMNRADRNITRLMYNRMNAATELPNSRWMPAGMYAFDLFMSYNEPALNAEAASWPSETNFFHKTNWRQILRGDWSTRSDWLSFITWNEPNVRQNRWPDHNDQLSFEYYSKGDYLLADSGEIKYLSTNPYSAIYGYSVMQHNSILFGNGTGNNPFPNNFNPSVVWPATNGFNTTYAGLDKGSAGSTVSHADVDNIIETPYMTYVDGKSTSNTIQSTPLITNVNIERSFLYPMKDYVVVIDRVNHLPRALDVINVFRLSSFNVTKTTSASAIGYTHGDLSIGDTVYDWKNMPQNAELSTGITTNSIEWNTINPYSERVTLDLFSAPSSAVNIIKHPSQIGGYQGYNEEVHIPVIYLKQPTDTSMYRVTALLSRYTNESPKTASELEVTGTGHAIKVVSADAQYSDYHYTGLGTSTFDSFTTDADTAFVRKVANITDYTFLNGTYLKDTGITKVQSTTRLKYLTYHKSAGGTAYVNVSGSGSTNLFFYNLTGTPSSVTIDGATPTWGMVDPTTLEITTTLSEHQIIFNEAGSTDDLVPISDFEATPTSGTSELPVTFTDKTLNFPMSYSWAYKESAGSWTQFSTDKNPIQNFTTGVYDINLTVANSAGQNSKIMTAYITVTAPPAPPTASFTADGTSGAISFNVSFFDTSIGSPTLWYWEFGDGTTSTDRDPYHIYTYNGTFDVNLKATNGAGFSWYNQSGYININSPDVGGGDIVGSFVSDVTSGTSPLTIQFTDTSLGSPIGWNWYFGDGVWDNSTQNPSHTYSIAGTYSTFLIASNDISSNQSANTTITVTESNATPTPIPTQTSSAGIACPTSAIGSGIAILGVALIVLAVVLVVAAVSGVSSGASGRAESGGSNFNLLLAGIAIFMIGAILVTVSLVIIYPLLGATGC